MIETPAVPINLDPNNEMMHRVRTTDMNRYKAKVLPQVTSLCGKTWAPTIPFTGNLRETPRCRVCFPLSDQHRFSIAV